MARVEPRERFAQNLRRQRELRGLSQEALGAACRKRLRGCRMGSRAEVFSATRTSA
jgi:hypothetical protein